jgi:hypothetical protein
MKAAADQWLQIINIQELQSKKHWEHKGELGHKNAVESQKALPYC